MEYKLVTAKWSEFDFLINNFFEIVEYKRGRGVYGDRVILKRQKNAVNILAEPDKQLEFYYLDALDVKEYPRTIQEKIKYILKFVIVPEEMAKICRYSDVDIVEWSLTTKAAILAANTLDYNIINEILVQRMVLLDKDFLNKLNKHKTAQYYIASSESMSLVSREYAENHKILK